MFTLNRKGRYIQRLREERQGLFEFDAVPMRAVSLGRAYARDHKARGKLCRLESALPPQHGAGKRRGKAVAGSVATPRHARGKVVAEVTARAVIDYIADAPFLIGNALQNHMFCAERRKFLEEPPDFRFALQPFAIFGAGQQAGLCEIRENIIRPAAKFRHLLDKREIKAGVERAVVRHRGVNNSETAGREERIHNLLHNRNLSPASEIARINRVKGNVLFLPLCGDFRHILGQIPEGKAVKICAGVIGEHR